MKQWAVLVGFFIFCIGTHIGMSHENDAPSGAMPTSRSSVGMPTG